MDGQLHVIIGADTKEIDRAILNCSMYRRAIGERSSNDQGSPEEYGTQYSENGRSAYLYRRRNGDVARA